MGSGRDSDIKTAGLIDLEGGAGYLYPGIPRQFASFFFSLSSVTAASSCFYLHLGAERTQQNTDDEIRYDNVLTGPPGKGKSDTIFGVKGTFGYHAFILHCLFWGPFSLPLRGNLMRFLFFVQRGTWNLTLPLACYLVRRSGSPGLNRNNVYDVWLRMYLI